MEHKTHECILIWIPMTTKDTRSLCARWRRRRRHTARNSTHEINVLVNVYARESARNALQSFVDCLLGSPLYFSCFWFCFCCFFAFFAFRIFIFLKNDFSRSSRHIAQIITTSASAFASAFYNERTKTIAKYSDEAKYEMREKKKEDRTALA